MNSFQDESAERVQAMHLDNQLQAEARSFFRSSIAAKYSYNFFWLGRPIIQYPQDVCALQEIIWSVRPDLIIETGIAHGGSLVLSASMLAMLDYCDASASGTSLCPKETRRRVLGVDIDIRAHNRAAIEAHPLSHMIEMIQGSSIDPGVVSAVQQRAQDFNRVLVILDSNHTHAHVLSELESYARLVTEGSYCVVFDTVVDDLPAALYEDRPWSPGDNPKTAVAEFMRRLRNDGMQDHRGVRLMFEVDTQIERKLLLTVAPGGFLRRVSD